MSPRRTSHSAWGVSVDGDKSLIGYVLAGVALLVAGLLLGWVFGHSTAKPLSPKQKANASAIIDPSITGFVTADKSENGALKAASSFVVGFPNVALLPQPTQASTVAALVAPSASSTL